jgi:uncharacterized protein
VRVALLEANVLLALLREDHEQHQQAGSWFKQNRGSGWATCGLTEAGLVRLAAQFGTPPGTTLAVLEQWIATREHQFWGIDTSAVRIQPEIRERMRGARQVTDAILLDLAIRRGGTLVTIGDRVRQLLPPDSPLQSAIEVIEA